MVSGDDFNMGSWMGEDMRNVVDAMARGDKPEIRGASGALNFDSKVFTNVLATVYYNYKLYGGRYIILDYNTPTAVTAPTPRLPAGTGRPHICRISTTARPSAIPLIRATRLCWWPPLRDGATIATRRMSCPSTGF